MKKKIRIAEREELKRMPICIDACVADDGDDDDRKKRF
jgi:hypothetical protein